MRNNGGMSAHENLLGGPPPTLLDVDPQPAALLEGGADPTEVAAKYPASSLAWAVLAERALHQAEPVAAYAYARTGYHRGLDVLRRSGWKGFGPIPWSHEPNRGFLRALGALARAAQEIGEADEFERCTRFLRDSDSQAAAELGL
jgi:hypothetical protein